MTDSAEPVVERVLAQLRNPDLARPVREVMSTGGADLGVPGLYSWWVDELGAADLVDGLGQSCVVQAGLIYVGLAGASHTGGKTSSNTLWRRITRMHLGHRHRASTLRRTLGSVLAERNNLSAIDEAELTVWMSTHLSVITVPVPDVQRLKELETTVLSDLDPPFNLAKVPQTDLRKRLRMLRKQYAGVGGTGA